MATLSPKGRIDLECVDIEIGRLTRLWSAQRDETIGMLNDVLAPGALTEIDPFACVQLAEAIRICRASRSLSEAARALFSASGVHRSTANDADRLRKYLSRFGLDQGSVVFDRLS